MSESNRSFQLPSIEDWEGGWGPSQDLVPSQFKGIPFTPFNKSERLGKIADWTQDAQSRQHNDNRRQNRREQAYGGNAENPFVYHHTGDDASFSLVDNKTTSKRTTFTRGVRTNFRGNTRGNVRGGRGGGRGGFQGRKRYGWKDYDRQRNRDPSIKVSPEWEVVEEIELNRIAKLSHKVDLPTDIATYGQLSYYQKKFDRPSNADKNLKTSDYVKYNVTTSEDNVINELAKEGAAEVFITDSILALLMCAPRSIAPWDVIINKVGDQIFFDKREGGPLDTITVNENGVEVSEEELADKDKINHPTNLSVEALQINQLFQGQVLDLKTSVPMEKPNPFADDELTEEDVLASCAYRYRKFKLGENLNLVVRCEIDALQKTNTNEDSYLLLRALNEVDAKVTGGLDWRTKLDSQRGAVVATEMRNNNCKLTRWATQALLGGCHQLKLGWVSRVKPNDPTRHQILTTMQYKPQDFLNQMNYQLTQGWGIVNALVRLTLPLDEGKYILVKDPNKPLVRMYKLTDDSLDNKDDIENDDEGQQNE